MQNKSANTWANKFRSKTSMVVTASMIMALLTPYMVPTASRASRSQTTNPNISNLAAATSAARSSATAEEVNPIAEPPEKSTDKGFSTEDFLQVDDGKKKGQPQHSPKSVEPPAAINVRVRVNVPQNTDAIDKFVAYPYPMPLPIPKRPPGYKSHADASDAKPLIPQQAYDKMPNTRKQIRNMIMTTGYTSRSKRNVAYPSGGWRWQMAYRNALKRCRLDEPIVMYEMYPFIDAMEPLVKDECKKMDELEEDRQRRYTAAYEEWQVNRSDIENEATRKGYFPIEFNLLRGWRGPNSAADLKLGPGSWWITGSHKVPGITYYWQQPVEVVNGQIETVDLNWQNALVIEGGW